MRGICQACLAPLGPGRASVSSDDSLGDSSGWVVGIHPACLRATNGGPPPELVEETGEGAVKSPADKGELGEGGDSWGGRER
jgi:hypothetical protein